MIPLEIVHIKREAPHIGDFHEHETGQLFLIREGLLAFEAPNVRWVIPAGYAGWVPCYLPHNAQTFGSTTAISFYVDKDLCHLMPLEACTFKPSELLTCVVDKFDSIGDKTWSQTQDNLLQVMLDEMSMVKSDQFSIPLPESEALRHLALEFMKEPSLKYTLEQWAKSIHMTKRTFTRKFKEDTGLSFNLWTQQVKLVKGCELLSCGQSVTTTAYQLGYENVTTFINIFKKFLGKTPKQFLAGAS